MTNKGFLGSLFDYSFTSFVTSKIVRLLYVLTTLVVALWTVAFIVIAFSLSTALGVLMLLIGGPVFFLMSLIYVRVALELMIVFFRISENVQAINERGGAAEADETFVAALPVPAPAV